MKHLRIKTRLFRRVALTMLLAVAGITNASATINSTTGIAAVSRESFTVNQIFDLNGRRVAQPKHGLYIVNGKKMIINN